MSLASGSRLGPYEIVSPLGAGGMGEVYRARDTRLDRTVAIKVLPSHLAQDPERRARFEREARAVSALDHPHICTLHDIGQLDGVDYIVLEYLEGETLAERLQKGPLPLEQALRLGAQIADALDKAHRAGIVHRDLKPGNVVLTKAGAKLLDFGLARAAEPAGIAPSLSTFPTQAKPLTEAGSLLGTFQYMAPEQVEGREVDARTDLFALGSVLYEMVTGKRAFEGKSQASLIAAILERQPEPISALQPMTPPALDHLVRRCLAKDPDERWQSAADVAGELKWIGESGGAPATARAGSDPSRRLLWLAGGLALGLAASSALVLRDRPPAESPRTALRANLLPPPGTIFAGGLAGIALSPDGRRLAFRAISTDGRNRLWVRSLESDEARPIEGTDTSLAGDMTAPNPGPFWSPDGRWLGFLSDGEVKKVDLSGGRPITLCAVPGLRGAAWGPDDVVLLGALESPILRVSAAGGTPQAVTIRVGADEYHTNPVFLPDGRHFLFVSWGGSGYSSRNTQELMVGSIDPGEAPKRLRSVLGARLVYSPTGHVLYNGQEGITTQPFRLDRLELSGEPRTLVAGTGAGFLRSSITASRDTLVLGHPPVPGRLAWIDRDGRILGTLGSVGDWGGDVALSPDGRQAVVSEFASGVLRLVVFDIATGTPTTVTSDTGSWEQCPAWSPDGRAVAFVGNGAIKVKRQDRGWADETLLPFRGVADSVFVTGWSPDGTSLVGHGGDPSRTWLLPIADRKVRRLIESTAALRQPIFSPDGRYVAFTSTQSGPTEVFVQPYPGPGERRQVSQGGGLSPRFSRDGRELFYLRGDRMLMATPFDPRTGTNGRPRALFQTAARSSYRTCYDVAPDGRFLFALDEEPAPPLILVRDWTVLLGPDGRDSRPEGERPAFR